ncbi:hypothetical protein [Streptomyces sp. F-1]|uniref:hypothetical protein n=1 Tax=Streptomyces sp. F-1 TaxID=463642 RepID=UPI00085C50E1|nr:hypothetical protein [Streptomyces sp. F-1]SFY52035.1 hypothetical protein STEPF1_05304 [Streptomyces sp. F-1]
MTLSNAELWAAGLGYALPPIIAIVNQPRWSSAVKGLLMLVVAVLDGLGTAYFNDQFTGKTIVTCMLTAAIAIGVAYHTVWRPSGIAPGIEQATSTGNPRPAPGA